ncbi:MAG: hypothetical protein K6G55_08110 [Selenomonadaceae bacterium]|nr:hypothetical protein [Selenomonadaceae bacterium]
MIHVCFGLHDKTGLYSKFTGTAILSMFENTNSEVTVHIIHDNTLSTENRDKFIYIAGRYNQHVKFYNVEELCPDKIAEMLNLFPAIKKSRVSVGAFYRLLSPQLITETDKCIYLDSDIIVNLDIKELWQIELGDKPLAACAEIEVDEIDYSFNSQKKYLTVNKIVAHEDYFNSGVLVMDLHYLRDKTSLILNGIKWRGEHPQCSCFDQDILNYLFSKNYLKLNEKFDVFISNERYKLRKNPHVRKAIYHYIRSFLNLEMHDSFNRLWMTYFTKTPWFNVDTIGRLYSSIQKLYINLKNSMAFYTSMMSGKTRAFFTGGGEQYRCRKKNILCT